MHTPSVVVIGRSERYHSIQTLLRQRGVAVSGELSEATALRLLPQLDPTLVVVDCAALGVNPLEVLPWIAALPSAPQVLAVGVSGTLAERRLMAELGASEYVLLGQAQRLAA